MDEVGIDKATGTVRIQVDPKYYRPTEVVSFLPVSHTTCPLVYNYIHGSLVGTFDHIKVLYLLSRIFYKEMQLRFTKL